MGVGGGTAAVSAWRRNVVLSDLVSPRCRRKKSKERDACRAAAGDKIVKSRHWDDGSTGTAVNAKGGM